MIILLLYWDVIDVFVLVGCTELAAGDESEREATDK